MEIAVFRLNIMHIPIYLRKKPHLKHRDNVNVFMGVTDKRNESEHIEEKVPQAEKLNCPFSKCNAIRILIYHILTIAKEYGHSI